MADKGDQIAKKDSTMIVMALVSALIVGGFLGSEQLLPSPPIIVNPVPVFNETNYSLNYGDHWTIMTITNRATMDYNVSLVVVDTVYFKDLLGINSPTTFVITNATGDIPVMTWSFNESVDVPIVFSFSDLKSLSFEPLLDGTRIDVTITDSGASYIVSEVSA